jgi:hypothetical protein
MATKTKTVEMAVRDPANAMRFVTEMVDVAIVRVNVRNLDPAHNGRVFNDVIGGEVKFAPDEVKTLDISEPLAAQIKSRRGGPWELTSAAATAPTLADETEDDEQSPEVLRVQRVRRKLR